MYVYKLPQNNKRNRKQMQGTPGNKLGYKKGVRSVLLLSQVETPEQKIQASVPALCGVQEQGQGYNSKTYRPYNTNRQRRGSPGLGQPSGTLHTLP